MTTLTDFANEIFKVESERDNFARTLIELREMLGITDNEVWTQHVLQEKLDLLASFQTTPPDLSVVEPK